MKSILAADCGSTTTTAVLIEQVGGNYRLQAAGQAPSTYGSPWENITVGVQQAVRYIEQVVERTLLSPGGWPITPQTPTQQGVDAFVVVSSAGLPLQVVIAGLVQDITLATARHAAATTYTHITNVISLDAATGQQQTPEARIRAIQEGKPDVVLLVGGTDGGAELPVLELAQVISMSAHLLQQHERPSVVFAGNQELRPQIADILGPVTALKSVNNIRPALELEDLTGVQQELEGLYIQQKMTRMPGFDNLSGWSKYPILPASKSFEKLITYLGRHNRLNVIGVDIGSRSTVAAAAQGSEKQRTIIRSDVGVGHSLASLLKIVPVEKIHRWLPINLTPAELYNALLNKSLYPASVPTTTEGLLIEHAVAREALRLGVNQMAADTQWNLVVGAGRLLTGTPQAAQAALTLIDGIEPWGVTSLVLDQSGVVNMLGAIAAVEPMAAVQVAISDAFLNLGSVVAPVGHGQPGKPALKIKINYSEDEVVEKEIPYGAIEMFALAPGKKATLEIRPARHFDIGLGQPGRGAVAEVEGGLLGIIVDARGRPLRLPKDNAQRQEILQQWLLALGATQ